MDTGSPVGAPGRAATRARPGPSLPSTGMSYPVTTNHIPREIPEQKWFMAALPSTLLAGVLPFGAVFIELFFIMSAIWENQFYYLFGFLFIVLESR